MHNNVFWKILVTTWRTQGKLREFGLIDLVDTMSPVRAPVPGRALTKSTYVMNLGI